MKSTWIRKARLFYAAVAMLVVGLLGTQPASAQSYPTKPIRLIVPFGAGGSVDIVARLIGHHMSELLGQPIVVEAKPGAGSTIGTDLVAKSAPDGYTLLMANSSSASAVSVYPNLPYSLTKDFVTIGLVGYTPFIGVLSPTVPAKNLSEFINLAKAKPGSFNYSSSGNGVGSHLSVELFKTMAGVDIVHVPFKGAPAAVNGLLQNSVQVMFVNLVSALPHVQAGKMIPLGIADSKRTALLPDVPTVSEAGVPGYEFTEWWGLMAPAETPREVVNKLSTALATVVTRPDMKERFAALGAEPLSEGPEKFAVRVQDDVAKYAKIVKDARIVPN